MTSVRIFRRMFAFSLVIFLAAAVFTACGKGSKDEVEQLKSEIEQLKSEMEQLKSGKKQAEVEKEEVDDEIAQVKGEKEQVKSALEQLQEERDKIMNSAVRVRLIRMKTDVPENEKLCESDIEMYEAMRFAGSANTLEIPWEHRNDVIGLELRSRRKRGDILTWRDFDWSLSRSRISLPGGKILEMVKVEAGSFTMSARDGENYDNEVSHRATLTKDFYIGRTEVTQAQWKSVMGNNPSTFKGDDLPVEMVSWNDAMEFCEKLNSMGKAPSGWKFSLPTGTQWEYAARGGKKSRGYKYSGSDKADDVAWYYENSGDVRLDESSWPDKLDSNHCKMHPVGQKKSNELGLYDMSGNVFEWCLDDFNDDTSKLMAEFTRNNDQEGSPRVIRGGSWGHNTRACRSALLSGGRPGLRGRGHGFRVVLVPESY